ncbi:factor of DNA methylation 3 isoform X2 [Arachis duranensis]|uniref:Factor of DNA methylation 3 isoform X2 n=1 Tax=Arachis duranensis TaxID=130453 RepID=A0A9C6TD47_ARADU|nr:factor of DNA methylation 3 isoform X2 [Arachis duranensis]
MFKVDPQYQIILRKNNAMKNSSLQIAVHEQEKANKNLLRLAANQEQSLREIGTLNQALIVKERKSNDELQDARKVLISGVKDVYSWQYWCEENGGT